MGLALDHFGFPYLGNVGEFGPRPYSWGFRWIIAASRIWGLFFFGIFLYRVPEWGIRAHLHKSGGVPVKWISGGYSEVSHFGRDMDFLRYSGVAHLFAILHHISIGRIVSRFGFLGDIRKWRIRA